MLFARFDALAAGESFVLVNSHDPVHLRQEFARDRPGAYDWRYLEGSRYLSAVALHRSRSVTSRDQCTLAALFLSGFCPALSSLLGRDHSMSSRPS
jgi:uncharacterized protein (DUF2249 family)